MRPLFISLLVFMASTWSLAFSEKSSTSEEKGVYLYQTYLASSQTTHSVAPVPQLTEIYGDLKNSSLVLFLFTAKTCRACRSLYKELLPKIKPILEKNPSLALIIRDYPTDPLSFYLSYMIWVNKDHTEKLASLFSPLDAQASQKFNQCSSLPDKSLSCFLDMILEACTDCTNEEKDKIRAVEKEFDKNEFAKKIFEKRETDKKILGLSAVPYAGLLIKEKTSWSFKAFEGELTAEKLLEAITLHQEKKL